MDFVTNWHRSCLVFLDNIMAKIITGNLRIIDGLLHRHVFESSEPDVPEYTKGLKYEAIKALLAVLKRNDVDVEYLGTKED